MLKIENIKKIILDNLDFYYRVKDEIFKNGVLFCSLNKSFLGDFYINNNELVLQDLSGIIFYKNHELKGYYNYMNLKDFTYLETNNNVLCFEQNGNFISTKIYENVINIGNHYISYDGNKIKFYVSYFNNSNWQFSLESLGTYRNFTNEVVSYSVMKFVGEYNNRLIIQLSNATLLFLDIINGKTGKIIHLNIEHPILPTCHYDDSFPPHLVGDQLLWLNNQRYFSINLNTYEIKVVKDYFKEPKENQFRFMSNTYFEGKLYFVADIGWQYVVPTRIGVMDAETGEVLWQQQLHKTGGLPEPPQVTQDKLFIRTTKGTLYIFENEYA